MTSLLSLYKATRAAYKPSAASISTNAAQDFRNHFWEAAAARSLKRNGSTNDEAVPSAPSSRVIKNTSHRQEDDKAGKLRKYAREDLFKHFRMSAASRAMKRVDGVMTKYFSLNEKVQSIHHCEGANALHTELPSLIDAATARKTREDMYHHFWSSHRAREDARNEIKTRITMPARLPTSTSAHHEQHLHEHRFKLPTTLNAYFKFGNQTEEMNHRPRPMAITEIEPPFKIVGVNKCWSRLCGYSREEAVGSTLKELLQGQETNAAVAKDLISSLVQQNNGNMEHEAVLVNYRSDGRKFKNHVRVGCIKDETGDTTHFVGLFTKLSDDALSDASNEDLYANV
mmetsp:Transcript_9322/g.16907  ORF Transcript_9322/g.16907 Transcript_9322/m.16907 type:complete len:342 (-) Transcript_9322:102-1127(-)